MATLEIRGYVNKLELKESDKGPYAKFTLACLQKRKDRSGKDVAEKLWLNCVDFKCKDLPSEGDYVGISGYVTISQWSANDKSGINIDVTVQSYEKLEQREKKAKAPKSDEPPPSDPFKMSPEKP